jgi:hypothetical protein
MSEVEAPIPHGLLMLFADEEWFQHATTSAEQARFLLAEHRMEGRLALADGFLQVGLTEAERRREQRDQVREAHWFTNEAFDYLRAGAMSPFDGVRGDRQPVAADWAQGAARGVMARLSKERAVEATLWRLSDRTRADIVRSIAAIIRQADAARRDRAVII